MNYNSSNRHQGLILCIYGAGGVMSFPMYIQFRWEGGVCVPEVHFNTSFMVQHFHFVYACIWLLVAWVCQRTRSYMCVCVSACVCACVCLCVCVCVIGYVLYSKIIYNIFCGFARYKT